MNKYEPVSSGLFSVIVLDAAFDGTLPATLAVELGRLVPPQVVVSLLSRHRRAGGSRTVIHPPHATGPSQRIGSLANPVERAFEGTVYSGDCDLEDGASDSMDSFLRLVLRTTRHGRDEIELRFPSRKADQMRPELARLMQAIAPDLVLAYRIATLAGRLVSIERLNDALLELLPFPALLLDRRGTLRRSNGHGTSLLARGTAIVAGADGRVHAINPVANAELHGVVEGQGSPSEGTPAKAAIVSLQAGAERVLMTLRHLGGTGDHAAEGAADATQEEEPATILVAHRTGGPLSLQRGLLEGTFGLSGKEAELAQSLLNGESIGAYAVRRRMSKQTLRNQLSGILRKTGTKRQAELIGLLTRLAFAPSFQEGR